MMSLDERLDEAERKIRRPEFMENRRLGNEVGYYIFDYDPSDELKVRERISYWQKRPGSPAVAVFDLYDIMIEILKGKGYLEKCFKMEKQKGFEKVSTAVANLMRVNSTEGMLVRYIRDKAPSNAVIIVTGIGKCFPVIRSHTVLNNLHLVIDNVPVIMFYPGKYNGQELILFDEIKDDNYYRAFRLVE